MGLTIISLYNQLQHQSVLALNLAERKVVLIKYTNNNESLKFKTMKVTSLKSWKVNL